jgi:hypothetical protein
LWPDHSYSTAALIEDCPYSRSDNLTQSMKAIYIPSDFNALNLKNPLDGNGNSFIE